MTRLRVLSLTCALPLKTRETVAIDAPEIRLTSYNVDWPLRAGASEVVVAVMFRLEKQGHV